MDVKWLHEGPEFQGSTGGRTQERLRARVAENRWLVEPTQQVALLGFWLRGGPLRRHVVAWVPRALERGGSSWNARLTPSRPHGCAVQLRPGP